MSKWIKFEDWLPTELDANEHGEIDLAETTGKHRRGQWDWIAPHRRDAAKLWQANGFWAWRKLV